jgi:hypothetical protein
MKEGYQSAFQLNARLIWRKVAKDKKPQVLTAN